MGSETLSGAALREAIRERIEQGPCRFHVVVPTSRVADLAEDPLTADGGGGSATANRAEQRLEELLGWLRDEGAEATGEVGDPDPVAAIEHALAGRRVNEVVLSTLPHGASRWLARDLLHRVQRAVDVPVSHVSGWPGGPTQPRADDGDRVVD